MGAQIPDCRASLLEGREHSDIWSEHFKGRVRVCRAAASETSDSNLQIAANLAPSVRDLLAWSES